MKCASQLWVCIKMHQTSLQTHSSQALLLLWHKIRRKRQSWSFLCERQKLQRDFSWRHPTHFVHTTLAQMHISLTNGKRNPSFHTLEELSPLLRNVILKPSWEQDLHLYMGMIKIPTIHTIFCPSRHNSQVISAFKSHFPPRLTRFLLVGSFLPKPFKAIIKKWGRNLATACTYCYHCQFDLHIRSPREFGSGHRSTLIHIGTLVEKEMGLIKTYHFTVDDFASFSQKNEANRNSAALAWLFTCFYFDFDTWSARHAGPRGAARKM